MEKTFSLTEAEWLACEEPDDLLLHLSYTAANDRRARLFGCACVRRVWNDLADDRLREALEVAERFADGFATKRQLETARKKADQLCEGIGDIIADHGPMAVSSLCEVTASWFTAAKSTAAIAAEARSDDAEASWGRAHTEEQRAQARIIRDIFGNPFRPVTMEPAWRSWRDALIVKLAQSAYDERIMPSGELDNARLSVVADALEEAGCTNEDILSHCRGSGPHVRGCWVLDALITKTERRSRRK